LQSRFSHRLGAAATDSTAMFHLSKPLSRQLAVSRPLLAAQRRGYYETVDGIKRNKKALEVARAAVSGRGDGRISVTDADAILATIKDGKHVTAHEFSTAFLIFRDFKFTPEGAKHFVDKLSLAPPVW